MCLPVFFLFVCWCICECGFCSGPKWMSEWGQSLHHIIYVEARLWMPMHVRYRYRYRYMFFHGFFAFMCLLFAACTAMTKGSRGVDSQVYWGYIVGRFCGPLLRRPILTQTTSRSQRAGHGCFIIIYCHDPATSRHTLWEIRPPLFRN